MFRLSQNMDPEGQVAKSYFVSYIEYLHVTDLTALKKAILSFPPSPSLFSGLNIPGPFGYAPKDLSTGPPRPLPCRVPASGRTVWQWSFLLRASRLARHTWDQACWCALAPHLPCCECTPVLTQPKSNSSPRTAILLCCPHSPLMGFITTELVFLLILALHFQFVILPFQI